jgi:predicted metal-dependent hydrolase
VRVTVDATTGVEVVLPRRAPEREAAAAIRELRPWIDRRLAELERTRAVIAARGQTVPYLGRVLSLVEQPGRTRVHRRDDELFVPAGQQRIPALERWYRRAARDEVALRLDAACAQTSNSYTALTIRSQRTRWASCTHRRDELQLAAAARARADS